MKDHMIDAWSKFTDPNELAHKLDEYELIRKGHKKQWIKGSDEKNLDKSREQGKFRHDKKLLKNKIPNWKEKNNEKKKIRKGQNP